jgi:hypothetical protein
MKKHSAISGKQFIISISEQARKINHGNDNRVDRNQQGFELKEMESLSRLIPVHVAPWL